jgi:hypothetical protein
MGLAIAPKPVSVPTNASAIFNRSYSLGSLNWQAGKQDRMTNRFTRRSFVALGAFGLAGAMGCRTTRVSDSFTCHLCGEVHEGLPTSFGAGAPVLYYRHPEAGTRAARSAEFDRCIIDGEHYFVRGCLDVRIKESTEVFNWGVWVSLSAQSFKRMSDLWRYARGGSWATFLRLALHAPSGIPGHHHAQDTRSHAASRRTALHPARAH